MIIKNLMGRSALATLTIALFSSSVHAAGVEAGTEVINEFTLNYKSSGIDRPQVDNLADPTRFIIDNRVDFTTNSNGEIDDGTPNQTDYEFEFAVTNLGNNDTIFAFSASDNSGDFTLGDPTPTSYWIDANNSGIQDEDEPNVLIGSATEPLIPQDVTAYVTVRASIPTSADNGEIAEILFTATATTGRGDALTSDASNTLLGEEIILDDGSGATDGEDDGVHTSTASVTIATAVLTGSKIVEMLPPGACDISSGIRDYEFATPSTESYFATPGACALYTISATNTGSRVATDVDIVDIVPSNLTLHRLTESGFTTSGRFPTRLTDGIQAGNNSGNFGYSCDGTAGTCNVAYTGATLDPGATGQITMRVRILDGAPPVPQD